VLSVNMIERSPAVGAIGYATVLHTTVRKRPPWPGPPPPATLAPTSN